MGGVLPSPFPTNVPVMPFLPVPLPLCHCSTQLPAIPIPSPLLFYGWDQAIALPFSALLHTCRVILILFTLPAVYVTCAFTFVPVPRSAVLALPLDAWRRRRRSLGSTSCTHLLNILLWRRVPAPCLFPDLACTHTHTPTCILLFHSRFSFVPYYVTYLPFVHSMPSLPVLQFIHIC